MDQICIDALDQLAAFKQNGTVMSNQVVLDNLIHLLRTQNADYRQSFGHLDVKSIKCILISGEKGFFSNVFQVLIQFVNSNFPNYECVLKVPLLDSLGKENRKSIMEAHNSECEFYNHFNNIPDFLLPQIFATLPVKDGQNGLIIMESLVGRAEALDLYGKITDGQVLSAARSIAQFQFYATEPERKKWWSQKTKSIYFDELYTTLIPTFYPMLEHRPEFANIVHQLKPLLNPSFGRYALNELPEKYGAITLVHADFQSHNLMFRLSPNGQVGDELFSIIDWQLCFRGNALTDLGKFLSMALDPEHREQIKKQAFDEYYNELSRLYKTAGMSPFEYERGFQLYDLVFCHTATVLLQFLPYVEQINSQKKEWTSRINTLSLRVQKLAESVIPLITKYGLERFNE